MLDMDLAIPDTAQLIASDGQMMSRNGTTMMMRKLSKQMAVKYNQVKGTR